MKSLSEVLGKILFLSVVFLLLAGTAYAEEHYFKFQVSEKSKVNELTHIISIDNVEKNESGFTVYAYANDSEFEKFLKQNIEFEKLVPIGQRVPKTEPAKTLEEVKEWDVYPTYYQFLDIMAEFETNYPDICDIDTIGTTTEGRLLLFAKISDNVDMEEDEPEVMHEGTMHGDETTGYIILLRFIDYLLSNYGGTGDDAEIANELVDNYELWIMPDMNPDGTYAGGSDNGGNYIDGATRSNANYVDLNRNFPDFVYGEHPDGNEHQPETIAMMNFMESMSFTLSANYHGGALVANYPWDTIPELHPDDDWFQYLSLKYSVNNPPMYNSPSFEDGITNGYAWYQTTGCRQDYANYFLGCREVTMEISNTKMPPASQMPGFWEDNKMSIIEYTRCALEGIRGIITDAQTGEPIKAEITVTNIEDDVHIYSDPDVGDYHRMLLPGTYEIQVSAFGYNTQTISNIVVEEGPAAVVDVQLDLDLSFGNLHGVVYDPENSPEDDVFIGLYESETSTDPLYQTYSNTQGEYSLTAVDTGYYYFKAQKFEYEIFSEMIHIQYGDNEFDAHLVQTDMASLTGEISDSEDNPIADANVKVFFADSDELYFEVDSESDGGFYLCIPEFTYYLKIYAEGYNTAQTLPFELDADYTTKIVLNETSGPAAQDFEDSDGEYTSNNSAGWQWGTDSEAGAHSGSKVWGTALNSDYPEASHLYLDTPEFTVSDGFLLTYYQWRDFEGSKKGEIDGKTIYDGGNVKISANGGSSFEILENFLTLDEDPDLGTEEEYTGNIGTGYNNPLAGEPSFAGNSGGWKRITFELSSYAGESVIIRFDFGSDSSVNKHGWYIDDVSAGAGVDIVELILTPTGINDDSDIPNAFTLKQNYPNPFNPNTAIEFSLEKKSVIELSIYNIAGRLVKTLAKGETNPGLHKILWDGKDINGNSVSSGIYYYKLETENSSQTKKMLLIK